ncbi:hypothetical protein V6N12_062233 [Hibiscus sabdariffa]|uniref:Uncharacterized protein n=1 Tax=Hibiscus sabdariffa TaxID=183260 RepID=A0ABR2F8C3_9ROSI
MVVMKVECSGEWKHEPRFKGSCGLEVVDVEGFGMSCARWDVLVNEGLGVDGGEVMMAGVNGLFWVLKMIDFDGDEGLRRGEEVRMRMLGYAMAEGEGFDEGGRVVLSDGFGHGFKVEQGWALGGFQGEWWKLGR